MGLARYQEVRILTSSFLSLSKIKVMTYSDKVKQSKNVLEAIKGLKDEEVLKVTYGVGFKGVPNQYTIRAYSGREGAMSYSIWSTFSGMNIDTIGKTTMKAYTYDMMSQKTTYVFPLYKINIIK
tara:strand:+ start:272 stop:643 length:372 start_codon:yes stop_codon:yes gene_type:complete